MTSFRRASSLEELQFQQVAVNDALMGVIALLIAKGVITFEEVQKMAPIVSDAHRRLSVSFSFEEGMKACIAAFKLIVPPDGKLG